jgi:exonuclease SbcC
MRPIRLQLEGFTAYREPTVCDFEGAELFVLTGPTGSGKSSIIDALTFALYGSVPRYGNPNLVHPVVSQGKLEAKVRFDFAAAGKTYTAVRVVRRTKTGATTREARLECDGKVLAGNADELTRRVRELLGLNFEQFTTCVVLPQGEFARFLHEKPAARQDLLTKLLGVEMYEQMGNLARVREAEARQMLRLYQDELERMPSVTEEARKAGKRRVAELEKVKKEIDAAEPELEALRTCAQEERTEAERIVAETKLLEGLELPRGVQELAEKIRLSADRLREALAERLEAEKKLEAARAEASRLGDRTELTTFARAHAELAQKRRESTARAEEAASTREELTSRTEKKKRAEEEEAAAREALHEARRELAAHELAAHLVPGEPCPVCHRTLDVLPTVSVPPAIASAEKALSKAERAKAAAEKDWQEASRVCLLAEERLRALEADIGSLGEKLASAPSPAEIEDKLSSLADAEKALAEATKAVTSTRETERRREKEVERLAGEERKAWGWFDEIRDRVATLKPPATERTDIGRAFETLRDWARERLPELRLSAESAASSARAKEEERERRLEELESRCAQVGCELSRARPRDAVITALASARQELETLSRSLERAKVLKNEVASVREKAEVAGVLGGHLRSTGFERWLLEEAFRRLVSGATVILKELASGQYSFEHDDRLNFEVIDHRNADERRSARTLSGGETFLASLALALTLAEQTAELATSGSARLESLFLDEGFGTLDDETLEIVASAIAELGAQGRVVGVVTHQPNLAATIPVQFRVNKNPVTSTITKVVL